MNKTELILFAIHDDILHYQKTNVVTWEDTLREQIGAVVSEYNKDTRGHIMKDAINLYTSDDYSPISELPRDEIILEICCLAKDYLGAGTYQIGSGLKIDIHGVIWEPLSILSEVIIE